jgi:hypothetical protein
MVLRLAAVLEPTAKKPVLPDLLGARRLAAAAGRHAAETARGNVPLLRREDLRAGFTEKAADFERTLGGGTDYSV